MYANYFMDYASYVILERAVPHINDGLKPVQRRILHSMDKIDDGRFNKVANIVGDTMKYHPHGDASIGDALVSLGQKNLLIETQGNWGNVLTGDPAAAPRYIEARLTPFAKEVVYSPKVTDWQLSYDGRNKEPITLPVKFPLLLAQGADGIAVGLSCTILPHNFNELIDASIASLRGQSFTLVPDFPTGGIMDASDYKDGNRGGRVRIRARIEQEGKKLLHITEVPFGVTTDKLIASILKALDNGKIKILKIEDNTAEHADILIHLPPNSNPDQVIQALYAFTDCEISRSANACVILDQKPHFLGVSDILRYNTEQTKTILRQELEIRLRELNQEWHRSSLERIFIENRIYLSIEDCETWPSILETIHRELEPFIHNLKQPVTDEDVTALTEIKIKRISKYDADKAEHNLLQLEEQIARTEKDLAHLTRYAIRWFETIRKKYGAQFPRRTQLDTFESVDRAQVAATLETLYLDEEGFAGYGVKKGEAICKCSTLDDVIIVTAEGVMKVVRIQEKFFAGKKPLYINILRKGDDPVFNLMYRDGRNGPLYAKRFKIGGFTRDRSYPLTRETKGTRIFHFSVHQTEEESASVAVTIHLKAILKLRNLVRTYSFGELRLKSRSAQGNIVVKHQVDRITLLNRPSTPTVPPSGASAETPPSSQQQEERPEPIPESPQAPTQVMTQDDLF